MSYSLTNKAMLVTLSIAQWSARKLDRRATAQTLTENEAQADAGRFNKNLLAGQDAELKEIAKIATAARTDHYTLTLPWNDDGARILSAPTFQRYAATMSTHREAFQAAVDAFTRDTYPQAREAARFALGKLFSDSDYPSALQVARKFSFAYQIDPLPDAGDFRVSLSATDVSAIQQEYAARYQAKTDAAMSELWQRVYQPIAHIAKTLPAYHDGDVKRFNDSLLTNLAEIVDLLPSLNLTGDEALNKLAADARAELLKYSPQRLRDDPAAAQLAAESAGQIANRMAAYMGDPAIQIDATRDAHPSASIVDLFRRAG